MHLIPWDVDVVALALPNTHTVIVGNGTTREERGMVIPVDGHIEHPWVIFKGVLCSVAMVHIPIQNQHSKETEHHCYPGSILPSLGLALSDYGTQIFNGRHSHSQNCLLMIFI